MEELKFFYSLTNNNKKRNDGVYSEVIEHIPATEKRPYYLFISNTCKGKMVFCNKCKKMVRLVHVLNLSTNIAKLECGCVIRNFVPVYLERRYNQRSIPTSCSVRKVDEKIQIDFSIIKGNYQKGLINSYYVDYKISINLITGKTYLITKSSKYKTNNRKTFVNDITYKGFETNRYYDDFFRNNEIIREDFDIICDICMQELIKVKKQYLNIVLKKAYDGYDKRSPITFLIHLNRFPNLSNKMRLELVNLKNVKTMSRVSYSCITQFTANKEVLDIFAKKLNFTNELKKIQRFCPKVDLKTFFGCYFGYKVFGNIDILKDLLNKVDNSVSYSYEHNHYYSPNAFFNIYEERNGFIKNIYDSVNKFKEDGKTRQLTKAKTYSIIKNKLIAVYAGTLLDSVNMYNLLKSQNPEALSGFSFSGSITDIHNNLSIIYSKCNEFNKKFSYSKKKIKEINFENDCYELTLALNSTELREIGNRMNICVGSYAREVYKKLTHIVSVKEKQSGKYVACIQLSKDFKEVRQAKAQHNKKLGGEVLVFVNQWIEEKQLLIETSDLSCDAIEDAYQIM